MTIRKSSKGQVVAAAKQLIAGAEKRLPSTTQVLLLGSSFTPDEVKTKLESLVALRAEVDAFKAATKAKIANEATQLTALRAFMSAFESFVKGAFGSSPDALADFGITPKARLPLTVEAKAAAAAKRASTRAARHTLSAKQKKGIKGDVKGVFVTPITASAPPAASGPIGPAAPATSANSPLAGTAETPRTT